MQKRRRGVAIDEISSQKHFGELKKVGEGRRIDRILSEVKNHVGFYL
jgi:hypothetical protein